MILLCYYSTPHRVLLHDYTLENNICFLINHCHNEFHVLHYHLFQEIIMIREKERKVIDISICVYFKVCKLHNMKFYVLIQIIVQRLDRNIFCYILQIRLYSLK